MLAMMFVVSLSASARDIPPGFEGAVIEPKPDARVPLDLEFQDDQGETVRLGDYFHQDRPVILTMIYFRCPTICPLTLKGQADMLRQLRGLTPGRDFEIVTVSFDPRETAKDARTEKARYVELSGRPELAESWHFLTSDRGATAKKLGDALGFGYKLDPKGEFYLHEACVYICTPDGRVSRTILGVQFEPEVVRDSLVYASEGKIGSGWFGVAVACGLAHFDPETGKYTWAALAIVRVTGLVTIIVMGLVIGTLIYREKRKPPQSPPPREPQGN